MLNEQKQNGNVEHKTLADKTGSVVALYKSTPPSSLILNISTNIHLSHHINTKLPGVSHKFQNYADFPPTQTVKILALRPIKGCRSLLRSNHSSSNASCASPKLIPRFLPSRSYSSSSSLPLGRLKYPQIIASMKGVLITLVGIRVTKKGGLTRRLKLLL
jgi:hypothetical protein